MRAFPYAAAVILVMAAAACTTTVSGHPEPTFTLGGDKVLDEVAVQDGVRKVLTRYGVSDVEGVTCPAHQKVKAGNKFTCTVTVGGASPGTGTVPITIKDDEGTYEVGQPDLDADAGPATVTSRPATTTGRVFDDTAVEAGVMKIIVQYDPTAEVVGVNCPPDQPVVAGTTFDCEVSLGGANPRDTTVTVTVKDDNGTYKVGQPK